MSTDTLPASPAVTPATPAAPPQPTVPAVIAVAEKPGWRPEIKTLIIGIVGGVLVAHINGVIPWFSGYAVQSEQVKDLQSSVQSVREEMAKISAVEKQITSIQERIAFLEKEAMSSTSVTNLLNQANNGVEKLENEVSVLKTTTASLTQGFLDNNTMDARLLSDFKSLEVVVNQLRERVASVVAKTKGADAAAE